MKREKKQKLSDKSLVKEENTGQEGKRMKRRQKEAGGESGSVLTCPRKYPSVEASLTAVTIMETGI